MPIGNVNSDCTLDAQDPGAMIYQWLTAKPHKMRYILLLSTKLGHNCNVGVL